MATIWGEITGLITDQDDLKDALNTKSNGLDKVTEEAGKTGWILKDNNGRLVSNPVGEYSVDFTWQNTGEGTRVNGATGDYSFAVGRSTLASGNTSTVFGKNNISSGDYSFSTGSDNVSSGLQSFTIGSGNTAEGDLSFAGGTNSTISASGTNPFQTGLNSFAFGDNLLVNNPNQTAFGSYNLQQGDDNSTLYKIFTVGIGDASGRQNAFEVFNGSGIERGSVKAPYLQQDTIEADITGKVLITKEYFESAYNNAFDDAPINGKVYGRKNKGWTEVAVGNGGSGTNALQVFFNGTVPPPPSFEIPGQPGEFFTPGDVYLYYNLPTVNTDGNLSNVDGNAGLFDGNLLKNKYYKQYILKDGTNEFPTVPNYWEEMTYGIDEASINGSKYVRKDGNWVSETITTDVPFDPQDPLVQYARVQGAWEEIVSTGSGTNIVFKGIEDPAGILPIFGTDGDKYMRYDDTAFNSSTYTEYTKVNGNWSLINWGIDDVTPNGNFYARSNSAWTQIELPIGEVPNTPIGAQYVRQFGAWIENVGPISSVPLDKQLENADIASMTYNIDNNLEIIMYGLYDIYPAGYTSNYFYLAGNLDHVTILDETSTLQLTITYTYVNGNLDSMTRINP